MARDFSDIKQAYLKINNQWEKDRDQAVLQRKKLEPSDPQYASLSDNIAKIDLLLEINNQAYFVLCWGEFEARVEEALDKAIKNGQKGGWKDRRPWNVLSAKLNFKKQLLIVVDENEKLSDPSGGMIKATRKIMDYYELRNNIAHGDVNSASVDALEFIKDMEIIINKFVI